MWSRPFTVRFGVAAFLAAASFLTGLPGVFAATMSWKSPSSGQFSTNSNWSSSAPGANDSAVFGVTGSYTVTFINSPSNQNLMLAAGTATLVSNGGPWTYNLTSTTSPDVSVSGGALVLGSAAGRLNVSASAGLTVYSGAALDLTNSSTFTTSAGTTMLWGYSLVSVGSGCMFNAYGSGLWVANGILQTSGGIVNIDNPGGGVLVSNSGQMSFPAGSDWNRGNILVQSSGTLSYGAELYAVYQSISVDGARSALQSASAEVLLGNGGTLNVTNGGYASCGPLVAYGASGNASAIVDGSGSSLAANSAQLGYDGQGGSLTVRNDANATVSGSTSVGADSYTNSSGTLLVNSAGSLQLGGPVHVGDAGYAGQSGLIMVGGSGYPFSYMTQTGSSAFTLGAASASSGSLVINSGGVFNTGSGAITVNKTGQISINDLGYMYLRGNLAVNGGTVQAPGGWLDTFSAPTGFGNIAVSNSGLMTFSGGGLLNWGHGNILVQSGGTLSCNSLLEAVGQSIAVDGTGTVLQLGSAEIYLASFGSMNVTNGGYVSCGPLNVSAGSMVVNSGGYVSCGPLNVSAGSMVVNSGGYVQVNGDLHIGDSGNSGDVGLLTVGGSGSAANLTGVTAATIGAPSGSSGTLAINSGGAYWSSGGTITVNKTGQIVFGGGAMNLFSDIAINGGALFAQSGGLYGASGHTISVTSGGTLAASNGFSWDLPSWLINDNGGNVSLGQVALSGTISLTRGSLAYAGNLTVGTNGSPTNGLFTIDATDLMQTTGDLSLGALQSLSISGTTTVSPYTALVLGGGALSTGVLSLAPGAGFYFTSGSLAITGSGGFAVGPTGPLGSTLKLVAGQNLSVANTATIAAGALLDLENGGVFSATTLANSGELFLNGTLAAASGGTYNNAGLVHGQGRVAAQVNNQSAGEVRIESGGRLVLQAANGPNQGLISLQGGTLELSQSLSNTSIGRITGRGTLIDNAGLTNQGSVQFSAGLTDVYGPVTNAAGASIITSGGGTTTFWNNLTNTGLVHTASNCTSAFFGTTTASGTGIFTGPGLIDLEGPHSGFAPVVVEVPSGSPQFASAVYLGSDGTFDITSGTLTVSGAISGDYALTKTGPGTLVLSGSNSFTGGTIVEAGKMIVTNPNGIADGTRLTVGDPSLFAPVVPALTVSPETASVPEPGTLMLCGTAVCTGMFYQRMHSRRKKR